MNAASMQIPYQTYVSKHTKRLPRERRHPPLALPKDVGPLESTCWRIPLWLRKSAPEKQEAPQKILTALPRGLGAQSSVLLPSGQNSEEPSEGLVSSLLRAGTSGGAGTPAN